MTDFTADREDAKRLEKVVREKLDEVMRGAARVSEFTVDMPAHFNARPPLTDSQYEVAVALNTLARLLDDRAEEACQARELRWEGLSDAAGMARNMVGHNGLPQLWPT